MNMVRIIDISGRAHYIAPAAIERVSEAPLAGHSRGIMSVVRLTDGSAIWTGDDAKTVCLRWDRAHVDVPVHLKSKWAAA